MQSQKNNEFDDISKSNNNDNGVSSGRGLQALIRAISCLPCFPSSEPKPDTPNLNQVNTKLNKN